MGTVKQHCSTLVVSKSGTGTVKQCYLTVDVNQQYNKATIFCCLINIEINRWDNKQCCSAFVVSTSRHFLTVNVYQQDSK